MKSHSFVSFFLRQFWQKGYCLGWRLRNMSLNFSHISSNVDKVLKLFLKKKILNKNHRNDSNMYFANLPLTLIRLGFFKVFFSGRRDWAPDLQSALFCAQILLNYRISHSQVFFKKEMFLKISQNLKENTCEEVSFLKQFFIII